MKCVLCDHDSFEDVSKVDVKTSEKLRVSMCHQCGFIQQNPLPTTKELKIYYSHNYRLDYKKAYVPEPKHIHRAGKTALQRHQFMKAAGIDSGNLLDVGAGGGEFVYLMEQLGYTSQGIEPNIGYSAYAKKEYGCNIKTGELNDIDGKYDVITLFHVLEHLSSPMLTFEKLYHALTPNGVLFIEVPWIEAKDASPHNIMFKAHLFYFSIDTLIACASQYFDAFKIDTDSNLKIFFRAKATPSPINYPSDRSVEKVKQRMNSKGWFEYLFEGKGIQKPIIKIMRHLEEAKVKNAQPKEILDTLLNH
ncbi:MAG: class I SAM-dependent methyltransferase [Methylococcales bacterium]|nr:class I SAM-dependent methyltransferase [Methylococcales bacterium]